MTNMKEPDGAHEPECKHVRKQGSTPRPPELNENPSLRIREKIPSSRRCSSLIFFRGLRVHHCQESVAFKRIPNYKGPLRVPSTPKPSLFRLVFSNWSTCRSTWQASEDRGSRGSTSGRCQPGLCTLLLVDRPSASFMIQINISEITHDIFKAISNKGGSEP